jgi:hypothetical protein
MRIWPVGLCAIRGLGWWKMAFDIAWLLSRTRIDEKSGCWIWTRCLNNKGYGSAHMRIPRISGAHRIAWFIANGQNPGLMYVLHHCDNPSCCNPDHLFIGTRQDNVDDMVRKGRNPSGNRHGARLHPESRLRGERHPLSKLTAANVAEIRRRVASGEKQISMCREFRVLRGTISDICRGLSWKSITSETKQYG